MKKRRNLNELEQIPRHNPVAKHAPRFNQAKVFEAKNQYRRKTKHQKQEVFPKVSAEIFGKTFCSV